MAEPNTYGFGRQTAKDLYDLVNTGRNTKINRSGSQPTPSDQDQVVKVGVAVDGITAGSSGTVRVYRLGVDTEEEIDAYLDWLTDEDISEGKQVIVAYFEDEDRRWRVIGAECEEIPPEVITTGNAEEPQQLNTTFTTVSGQSLLYSSGEAILESPSTGILCDDLGNVIIDDYLRIVRAFL